MSTPSLQRELTLPSAVLLGLGSIVGTGAFVSIAFGADLVGPGVIIAIAVAGLLAACNALSSAQLAAAYPVAGGTYEYAHRLLTPALGFTAGWMFIAAKTASAATAALGASAYILRALDVDSRLALILLAIALVGAFTALVANGIRRTSFVNAIIVGATLIALAFFIIAGLIRGDAEVGPVDVTPLPLLEASALMFVAYTGYGRIATLGEEVRNPERTIPRAIIATLLVSAVLYIGVGLAGLRSGMTLADAAPLEAAAARFNIPGAPIILAIGAVTAMLGVLLNLILGLSRVVLAMGRRGELPEHFAHVRPRHATPLPAVIGVGVIIGAVTAIGSIKLAWSFSAFTVLIYYAITNLAALRLPKEARRYPRAIAWLGLAGCLGLAFFVPWKAWAVGLAVLAAGHILKITIKRVFPARSAR